MKSPSPLPLLLLVLTPWPAVNAPAQTRVAPDSNPLTEARNSTIAAAPQIETVADRGGEKFYSGPQSTGTIALTFDDGPHPKYTRRLLELLKRENVRATFFMLGEQVEKFPAIAREVALAGFEIGNHGYKHDNPAKMSLEALRRDVERTQQIIKEATGVRCRLYRPPYGVVNSRVRQVTQKLGMDIVHWSIDPRDWDRKKTSQSITAKIVNDGRGGDIVCIHDIHARTIDAIPAIITGVRAKGLDFATVGEIIRAERDERMMKKLPKESSGSGNTAEPEPVPLTIPLKSTSRTKIGQSGTLVDPQNGESPRALKLEPRKKKTAHEPDTPKPRLVIPLGQTSVDGTHHP